MPLPDPRSLWDLTAASGCAPHRFVSDADHRVALADLPQCGSLEAPVDSLRNKSVLLLCERQLPAVLALLQLDGVARRILLCPPDLAAEHIPDVIALAQVDVIVSDRTGPAAPPSAGTAVVLCRSALHPSTPAAGARQATEWMLFTSGTTGRPKLVVHSLSSLVGPLDDGLVVASDAVWSTFYDVRRYGGLQILLRALLGGGSMVLSQADEPTAEFLARAGRFGVTHISGTPSHWRRALMSGATARMAPRYVRLSGEVADQAILDNLAVTFPSAGIAHAFASTEAGVAFDVRDGLAGFPAELIGQADAKAQLRIEQGTLRIRSSRTASRYLGDADTLAHGDGFVDTGDMVELHGDRYHFVGRREGVINVGGLKVYPEEVEAVINRHPDVQVARVRARPSPVTGAIVVADIVPRPAALGRSFETIREEILEACRRVLPPHKVPAMLRQVAAIEIAGSGKLVRPRA